MSFTSISARTALVLGCFALAGTASAVSLCNNSPEIVSLAFVQHHIKWAGNGMGGDSKYRSTGWRTLPPGACADVPSGSDGLFYYGYGSKGTTWSNTKEMSNRFCIRRGSAFEWNGFSNSYDNTVIRSERECRAAGGDFVGFRKVTGPVSLTSPNTAIINPPPPPSSTTGNVSSEFRDVVVRNFSNRDACISFVEQLNPAATRGWARVSNGQTATLYHVAYVHAEECGNTGRAWNPGWGIPVSLCVHPTNEFRYFTPENSVMCGQLGGQMVAFTPVPRGVGPLDFMLTY